MSISFKKLVLSAGAGGMSLGKQPGDLPTPTATPAPAMGGQLWVWGNNYKGKLGDNTTDDKSSPVQTMAGGSNWTFVIGGYSHTAAIKKDGTLWTWGTNTYYGGFGGQLGDATSDNKSSPIQTIAGGTNWSNVACGAFHTAAIKTDGTLWTWGNNGDAQLGDNTITSKDSPVQTIAGGSDWSFVSCGNYHTAAIKTDGTLWLWGGNSGSGRLGDDTNEKKSSPVQTIAGGTNWSKVACGAYHNAAIKTDGTLWTWGSNYDGRLGDDTTDNKSSPVQTIVGGTNWSKVASGNNHTAAIKTDGTLWLWGKNNHGQLGDNTRTNRSSPIQTIVGGSNWNFVACGYGHTAAIKTDGTLWMWGVNYVGAIGDNTTVKKSSPVQTIAGGSNWTFVACDKYYNGTTYAIYA